MYLRNFLVVAQLTILFGDVMSAAAPAAARQRSITNILCDFCGKSFPNSFSYDTGCYLQATELVVRNWLLLASDTQSGAIGNQSWYHGNSHAFSKSFTRQQRLVCLDSKISKTRT
jgi:hypothetical protein